MRDRVRGSTRADVWGLAQACAGPGGADKTMGMRRSFGWREVVAAAVCLGGCGEGGSEATGSESSGGGSSGSESSATGTTDVVDPTTGPGTSEPGDGSGESSSAPTSTSTSTGSSDDGGSSDATGPDTEAPLVDVPVFIAQGHYGRTTISCDDGKTWVQDRSQDDAVRCFENDLDCDHNEYAGRGIAWGDNQFVLTWGWGAPGTLVRSDDAATFTTVLTDTPTFADVAFGNGRFVANNSPTRISDDGGLTWTEGGPLDININTRAIGFVPHEAGVFIVTGESGDKRAIVRSPDGVTWTPAKERPPGCGSSVRGLAYGNGVTLLANGNGTVCRSLDGGDVWEQVGVSDQFSSPPVWTGSEFYVYQGGTLHHSADGTTWMSEPIVGGGSIGQLARSPEGTFVAANDGWMQWYEKQRFFRSTDGKSWETLAEDAFVGSHPIYHMAYGRVAPGAGCPG